MRRVYLFGMALAGTGVLYLLSRTKAGSAVADSLVSSTLDFATVSASRIGGLLSTNGYAINNPGNIRFIAKNPWNGQVGNHNGFGVYDTPMNGTRALGRELDKRRRAGFRTVRDIIAGKLQGSNGDRQGGWAPSSENDTEAYVNDVANQLGVNADQQIDVDLVLGKLARGIAKHENGYVDSTYNFDAWVRL